MRSEFIGVREIPPPPPPRKTTFVYAAFLAGLIMLLIAGSLYAHVLLTKRWLTQIKSEAAARASSVSMPIATVEDTNRCPADRPVLTGFDDHGKSICRALPRPCGPGQYIAAIDPATLELRCADAGGVASCPPGQYLTEFAWLGEGRVSFSCHPRLDPFATWKFTPVLGSRGND